jgi:L-ascorbate metabolism protein UlaG (beta-lactamase superfamily)
MRRALLPLLLLVSACSSIPQPRQSAYHGSDADLGVTRVVHGTMVIELTGTRLLVDPWFHSSLTLRQAEALGLMPDALPTFAAVLLTDDDSDHFDASILTTMAASIPRAVVPPSLRDRTASVGFKEVVTLRPWEKATIDGVTITAVPTMSGTKESGYVAEKDGVSAFVAPARTDPAALVDIATAFPALDVAMLPIGGRRVVGMLSEMDPAQAAQATATLKPKKVIPIGYGAKGVPPFVMYPTDPVAAFRDDLKSRKLGDRLIVLQPGESWHRYE